MAGLHFVVVARLPTIACVFALLSGCSVLEPYLWKPEYLRSQPRQPLYFGGHNKVQWQHIGHTDARDWPAGQLYLGIGTLGAIAGDERGGWFVIDFDDDTKKTKSLTAFASANCKTGGLVASPYMYEHDQRQGRGEYSVLRSPEPLPLPNNATFSKAKERICRNPSAN